MLGATTAADLSQIVYLAPFDSLRSTLPSPCRQTGKDESRNARRISSTVSGPSPRPRSSPSPSFSFRRQRHLVPHQMAPSINNETRPSTTMTSSSMPYNAAASAPAPEQEHGAGPSPNSVPGSFPVPVSVPEPDQERHTEPGPVLGRQSWSEPAPEQGASASAPAKQHDPTPETESETATQSGSEPEARSESIGSMLALPVARPAIAMTSTIEEDDGVIRSGMVLCGFAPVRSKKMMYCVILDRVLELHDNEKAYRKRKMPRVILDLSVTFNAHKDHFDPKLKNCVCLMTPGETLLIRGESAADSFEWYEAVMSSVIPARALKLGRPVMTYEFFESAWDVDIVEYPKFKKPRNFLYANIVSKVPALAGPKRLCFYPHTILVFNRNVEPTTCGLGDSEIPPFPADSFIELPRTFVAFFGCQEKFFLLRMGRGSAMGGSELWAQCETEDVALNIHYKLNTIIERESEKKKIKGQVTFRNGTAPSLSSVRMHRERSHTQPMRQRIGTIEENCRSDGMKSLSVPTPHSTVPLSTRDRRAILRDCHELLDSFEEEINQAAGQRPRGSLGSFQGFQPDLLARLDRPRGSVHSLGSATISDRRGQLVINGNHRPSGAKPLKPLSAQYPPPYFDSYNQAANPPQIAVPRLNMVARQKKSITEEPNYQRVCPLNDYMDEEPECQPGPSEPKTLNKLNNLFKKEKFSEMTAKEKEREKERHADYFVGMAASEDEGMEKDDSYVAMDIAKWGFVQENAHLLVPSGIPGTYKLDEVRSYITDSTDSCYSSLATNGTQPSSSAENPPRAHSFGGRTNEPLKPQTTSNPDEITVEPDIKAEPSSLAIPVDDPRKRAFSLGSKTFFNFIGLSEFRKLVKKKPRPTSPSQSASPASTSLYQLPYFDKDDANRNRTGSFGSGRSSPFGRSLVPRDTNMDSHVEMDFGDGRSGSGSVASMDSPSRKEIEDEFLIRPSDLVLAQARQNNQGDYVFTDTPTLRSLYSDKVCRGLSEKEVVVVLTAIENGVKSIDLRSSQLFETIQEATSLKSSRSSSRTSVIATDEQDDLTPRGDDQDRQKVLDYMLSALSEERERKSRLAEAKNTVKRVVDQSDKGAMETVVVPEASPAPPVLPLLPSIAAVSTEFTSDPMEAGPSTSK